MKGCGLFHARKRLLKVRYIRTISTGRGYCKRPRQCSHVVSTPTRKQTAVSAPSLQINHKSSPGLVRGPFVAHHKICVEAMPTSLSLHSSNHLKNGMEMMKAVKNKTTKEGMINKRNEHKGQNSLVRATSGNVMIYGHLGNLGGLRGQSVCSADIVDFLPRTTTKARLVPNTNILKNEGNTNRSRYTKALESNDSATLIDSKNVSLSINTIKALVTSGQILEAVDECRRILRIDPRCKEVNRVSANMYIR